MSNTSRAVILTILICNSYVSVIEAEQVNNIPEFLMTVLKKYDNYKKPSNEPDSEKTGNLKLKLRKSSTHSDIDDAIRAKVAELAPLLDDRNDREEKHNHQKGDSIAFHESKNSNPAKIKYKNMRKRIEKLMKLEPISDETKRVVIEILEQIEKEFNGNDCYLNKVEGDVIRRGHSGGREPSIVIPKDMEHTELIMKHIKEKWDKIVYQYSMPEVDNTHNETARKVAFVFLTRLRQFVFDIHEDYTKLQNRYELKCFDDVANKEGFRFPVFRPDDNTESLLKNNTDDCDITICTEELLDFLTDFYNQLNVTCSEVFKNYMVMYLKEIDAGTDDKEKFTEVLEHIEDHVHKKVKKMFTTEIGKFNEMFNLSSSKVDALKHLIDGTIHNAKELIYESLSLKLRNKLKPNLRLIVKQDIYIATGIELGNLKKEFKDKMCSVFRHCNTGSLRKSEKRYSNVDPNSLKIRFKFGLGDDPLKLLKPYLRQMKYKLSSGYEINGPEVKDLLSARKTGIVPFDIKEFEFMNVTRTTYADYVLKGTTKSVNSSLKNDTNGTIMESPVSY